jgi:hypothetical protein
MVRLHISGMLEPFPHSDEVEPQRNEAREVHLGSRREMRFANLLILAHFAPSR